MNDISPIVSVVMPVFNGEAYLKQAIKSVLSQTLSAWELIIVDDGSTDASSEIIAEFSEARIRVIRNESNRGITVSRNLGVDGSRGKYVAALDCDDLAHEDRFAAQALFLDEHPEYVMVGSWAEIFHDGPLGQGEPQILNPNLVPEEVPAFLLFQNCFVQSSVMMRRDAIPTPAYRDFEPAEDYDLWVRLARIGKLGILRTPLAHYRIHDAGVSQAKSDTQEKQALRIVAEQLTKLRVVPTQDDLLLHRTLVDTNIKINRQTLLAIEIWLLRIIDANGHARIYEPAALDRVISAHWRQVCKRVLRTKPSLIFQCWKSPLSRGQRLRLLAGVLRLINILPKGRPL